jgi:uncharacterized protein YifE (UPF0438 family)
MTNPQNLQRPFVFGRSTGVFTELGTLLESLSSGALQPATPDHERFLLVDREEAEPLSRPTDLRKNEESGSG